MAEDVGGVRSFSNWKKLTSAAFEQGSISAMNFGSIAVLGVLLAPEEFSTYVVLMALLTVSYLINLTLWGVPALVFSQTTYVKNQSVYARRLLFNAVFSSLIGTLLVSGLFSFLPIEMSPLAWWWAVLACVAWTTYEVSRRICFSMGHLSLLVRSSFVILFFYGTLISAAATFATLSLESALAIWFISFFVGSLITARSILSCYRPSSRDFSLSPHLIFGAHWRYAKWQLLGALAFWFSSSGFIFLASYQLDAEEIAALRLAQNLLGLSSLLLLMFENVLTPRGAVVYQNSGVSGVLGFVRDLYKTHISLYLFGLLGVFFISFFIYRYFYAATYDVSPVLLLYFLFFYILMGILFPLLTALRILSKTKYFWYAHAGSAVFMITGGLLMVRHFGVLGGGVAFLGSALVFSTIILTVFWFDIGFGSQKYHSA